MAGNGPVPKRSTERRRRNKEAQPEIITVPGSPVEAPKANSRWHPIAKRWYESLVVSGQAQFYEPSDWALAQYVAEAMSRNLRQQTKFSSVLFAAVLSAMSDLLVSEGARRRARLEIERAGGESEPPAGVTALAEYRQALSKKK